MLRRSNGAIEEGPVNILDGLANACAQPIVLKGGSCGGKFGADGRDAQPALLPLDAEATATLPLSAGG